MNTAIVITLIICGTIVLLSIISAIGTVIATKKASKVHKTIMDVFKEEK